MGDQLAGEHPKWVVLREVVAGEQGPARQRERQVEQDREQHEQTERKAIGSTFASPQGREELTHGDAGV